MEKIAAMVEKGKRTIAWEGRRLVPQKRPSRDPHLLHLRELGGQAAVHAKDLLVHNSGHGEAVEAVDEGLPQLDVVPGKQACQKKTQKNTKSKMTTGRGECTSPHV